VFKVVAQRISPWRNGGAAQEGAAELDPSTVADRLGLLTLEKFNLEHVLQNGAPLLASRIQDDVDPLSISNPEAWFASQQRQIAERLGLIGDPMDSKLPSFLEKQDIMQSAAQAVQSANTLDASQLVVDMTADPPADMAGGQPGLTARQQNRAKRKAKALLNAGGAKRSNIVPDVPLDTPSTAAGTGGAGEEDVDRQQLFHWPMAGRSSSLCLRILDTAWEVRHGAAGGLLQIIKVHGHSFGVPTCLVSPQCELQLNTTWLTDLALRAVCILALDRFGDYSGGGGCAPVRDAASKLLGAVAVHLPAEIATRILDLLFRLAEDARWETRHGGFLGLQAVLEVHRGSHRVNDPRILPMFIKAIKQDVEDLQSTAAAVLHMILQHLVDQQNSDTARSFLSRPASKTLCTALWGALATFDDLSTAAAPIMKLLDLLYCSTLEPFPPAARQACILSTMVFFCSSLFDAKQQSVHLLRTLLCAAKAHDRKPNSSWLQPMLPYVLNTVFYSLIYEHRECVLADTKQLMALLTEFWSHLLGTWDVFSHGEHLIGDWLQLAVSEVASTFVYPQFQHEAKPATSRKKGAKGKDKPSGTQVPIAHNQCQQISSTAPFTEAMRLAACIAIVQYLSGSGSEQLLHSILKHKTLTSSSNYSAAMLLRECVIHGLIIETTAREIFGERGISTVDQAFNVDVQLPEDGTRAVALAAGGLVRAASQLGEKEAKAFAHILLGTINNERDRALQELAGSDIALLIRMSTEQLINMDEVISSLCIQCSKFTAQLITNEDAVQQQSAVFSASFSSDEPVDSKSAAALANSTSSDSHEYFGSKVCLCALAKAYGVSLFSSITRLSDICAMQTTADLSSNNAVEVAASVVSNLISELHPEIAHVKALGFASGIAGILLGEETCSVAAVQAVARMFSCLCKFCPQQGVIVLVEFIAPNITNLQSDRVREAAVIVLSRMILAVGLDAGCLPLMPALLKPCITAMCDQSDVVRCHATQAFARVVTVSNLDSVKGCDTSEMAGGLREHIDFGHKILRQMTDGGKPDQFDLPFEFANQALLRDYQQEGVNWLAFLRESNLHGLLADDMGLGKTLQVLSMVVSDALARQTACQIAEPLPSLILCPSTLVDHWYQEVHRFFPEKKLEGLSLMRYAGNLTCRKKLRRLLITEPHHVIVMSYHTFVLDAHLLRAIVPVWSYAVLDEGHAIKNPDSVMSQTVKTLRAHHRLILTGTPIQNDITELWSLFDFLLPGLLGNKREFAKKYAKDVKAARSARASEEKRQAGALALRNLNAQVQPFILRRTKDAVLKDLPPKIIQDYACELTPLQRKLYNQVCASAASQEFMSALEPLPDPASKPAVAAARGAKVDFGGAGGGSSGGGGIGGGDDDEQISEHDTSSDDDDAASPMPSGAVPVHVFSSLRRLQQIVSHPKLLLLRKGPRGVGQSAQAPALGADLDVRLLDAMTCSGKLLALRQLLLDIGVGDPEYLSTAPAARHRCLVFAQHTQLLDLVVGQLLQPYMPHVKHLRMDGQVPPSKRQALVDAFNADASVGLLLLTTKVGGVGLNLTGADTVIFLEHDWNPMQDLQAMDRVHRLGQQKAVSVYRLVTRGTLEERIMSLQQFKLHVANSVVKQPYLDGMAAGNILELLAARVSSSASAAAADADEEEEVEDDEWWAGLQGNADDESDFDIGSD
jgi:superfamily II DNA or RNA helicase